MRTMAVEEKKKIVASRNVYEQYYALKKNNCLQDHVYETIKNKLKKHEIII